MARSAVVYVHMYSEESRQWRVDQLQLQCGRQMRNIHDTPLDEVEDFDAVVRNGGEKLEISMEPAMSRAKLVRIPTSLTPTWNVAVSKEGGE